jgi:hypothetical protein
VRENGRKAVAGEEKGRKVQLVSREGPLQSRKPKAKPASVGHNLVNRDGLIQSLQFFGASFISV